MGVIDGLVFMERVDRFVYRGKQGAVPVTGVLEIEGAGSRCGVSTTTAPCC